MSGNEREPHITLSQVQERLCLSKASCSRRIGKTALQGGWLVNGETRKGCPFQLGIGDPLPAETRLLQPECLTCSPFQRKPLRMAGEGSLTHNEPSAPDR